MPEPNSAEVAAAPGDLGPAVKQKRGGSFAMFVAAGILLSRIFGLVREKVFAHYLGNSDAAGVFKAALRIPNMLQNLFGEGVLSASFIPVYARLLAEGDEEMAGRVAGVVASLLALVTSALVLLGVLFTPQLLFFIAPGFKGDVRELTISVVRILFPAIGLLVVSAWCLGILNSHRKFFLSYVAPVFMNICMIGTLFIFGGRMTDRSLAVALAWGTVVGAAAQFLVQVPFVLKHEKRLRFAVDTKLAPVQQVLRNFVPVVVGKGVVQLSAYLDNLIATLLGTAATAAIGYAQTLAVLPVSLFGMSVSAAELPAMSSATGSQEEINEALRKRLERGLRQIAFFVIPSVVAFILIGNVLVAALFQGGRFGDDDTRYVWYILIGSTVGLLAATLGRLYSSAFYALHDTKTPLRYAMLRVSLTGVLGYLFALPLRPLLLSAMRSLHIPMPLIRGSSEPLGAIALTATAGIAGWIEFALLRRSLSKRIGRARLAPSFLLRLWAAALAAGVASAAFYWRALPHVTRYLPHIFPHVRDGALVCALFGAIYFAAAAALRVEEVRGVVARFRR
ncbi:MAG TPA: murein biosynthesis integral membrane protein MurJ [Thermoanaerobaculia bacterium]|nr:murein biosynthesis integral membrane protein MurJ [Thermoanaerobaculia bacterium]